MDQMDKSLNSLPIADLYTGTMMTTAVSRFVRTLLPRGIHCIRSLPIVLFIDKSHTDLFGTLATTPLSWTLGVFNCLMRRKHEFWRNQAFIPPLHVGKGKNAGQLDLDAYLHNVDRRSQQQGPKPIASVEKLKDYHQLLREGLKPLHHACKNGIIVEHRNGVHNGEVILYQPFILLSIGDTSGNNELVCHHNNSGNSKSPCLSYKCQCSFPDLIKTPVDCTPITHDDIEQSLVDSAFAQSISQHQVKSAFHDMALPDRKGGLMSAMPREWLHVFPQGLFMATTKVIHNIIGTKNKNAKFKDHFNMLHQRVSIELHRNSDRGIPRTASRGAYFDMSCCFGVEKEGNLYCADICFHTFQGKGIMKPFLDRLGIPMSKFCYTIQLLLSYSAWIQEEEINRWEVCHALPVVEELMNCMVKYLPNKVVKKKKKKKKRNNNTANKNKIGTKTQSDSSKKRQRCNVKDAEIKDDNRHRLAGHTGDTLDDTDLDDDDLEGSNGWHTTKFHSLAEFIVSMQSFGSASNFDSSHGEAHHKEFVKKPGRRTKRDKATFTKEVGLRYDESQLIRKAHSEVEHLCPPRRHVHHYSTGGNCGREQPVLRGRYVLEMENMPGRSRSHSQYTFKHVWGDHKKTLNRDQHVLHNDLQHALAIQARKDNFHNIVSIIGYTEVTFPDNSGELTGVTFRASPNFRGLEWYDWALVKYPGPSGPQTDHGTDDGGEEMVSYRPAKVLGFVQYMTKGYPTPNLCKTMTKDMVWTKKAKDTSIHVVLDCANDDVIKKELDSSFVTPFELNPDDSGMMVLPIECIAEPMIVVTNYRAKNKSHYLACLAKRKWGNVFRQRIKDVYEGRLAISDDNNDKWWANQELYNDEIEPESDDDDTQEEAQEENETTAMEEAQEENETTAMEDITPGNADLV